MTKIRIVPAKDVSKIVTGIVDVDEKYIGRHWKNKRKSIHDHGTKRGSGTQKHPVFGSLFRKGQVWAEVVDDVEAETLQPRIPKKVFMGSTICSGTWKASTGIATRVYVHPDVSHGENQDNDGNGNYINGREVF